MVEPGQAFPLEEEAKQVLRPTAVGQDHLQGNHPVGMGLPGKVNNAHAAPAQLPFDPVTGQLRWRPIVDRAGLRAGLVVIPGRRRRARCGTTQEQTLPG